MESSTSKNTTSDKMGYYKYVTETDAEVRQAALNAFTENPDQFLERYFEKEAVLSDKKIKNIIARTAKNLQETNEICKHLDTMAQAGKLICLKDPENNITHWTTPEMDVLENDIVRHVREMKKLDKVRSIDPSYRDQPTLEKGSGQERAYQRILAGERFIPIEGYAGAGKSYALKLAVDVIRNHPDHQEREQIGLAQGDANAIELGNSVNIPSHTIKDFIQKLEKNERTIDENTDLILDEANMVGTREMHKVLQIASEKKARLILVGDRSQLRPWDAGSPFNLILDACKREDVEIPVTTIDEVRRQTGWSREASIMARSEETLEQAIGYYEENGKLEVHPDSSSCYERVAEVWRKSKLPIQGRLIIAARERDRVAINGEVRARRYESGDFRENVSFSTPQGPLIVGVPHDPQAGGERIVFTEQTNLAACDCDAQVSVHAGMRGTVKAQENGLLRVVLDDMKAQEVFIDPAQQQLPIDYGYTATPHEAEGKTVHSVAWYASEYDSQQSAHIALTRAKDTCTIVASKKTFNITSSKEGEKLAPSIASKMKHRPSFNVTNYQKAETPLLQHFSKQALNITKQIDAIHSINSIDPTRPRGKLHFRQWFGSEHGVAPVIESYLAKPPTSLSWEGLQNALKPYDITMEFDSENQRLIYKDDIRPDTRFCREGVLKDELHYEALQDALGKWPKRQKREEALNLSETSSHRYPTRSKDKGKDPSIIR